MEFKKFYVIQYVIDDLKSTKKRVPRNLKELIRVPEAGDFLIYKRLNTLEKIEFYDLLYLKTSKKMVIDYLDVLKYYSIGIDNKTFKLNIRYLQNICDFIENYKDRLTDGDYKHDLEYLATFY